MENSPSNDAEASENRQEIDEKRTVYPLWVKDFLEAKFYKECEDHPGRNCMVYFCKDCMGEAFCENSAHRDQQGHRVIRVFKTSNLISVPPSEIKELDISNISRCKCNSDHKIFLYPRKKENTNSRSTIASKKCRSCCWDFIEKDNNDYEFCSLSCKIESTGNRYEDSCEYPINLRKRNRRKGIPTRSPVGGLVF